MYQEVKDVVLQSGLWNGCGERTHGFILSPDVYELQSATVADLEKVGRALFDCLIGLGRIATIAQDPRLGRGWIWSMISRALRTGVPSSYHSLQVLDPNAAPGICKVDFMESEDGNFRIAEIDGHNKHGLGYSTLAARMRNAAAPGRKYLPGVAKLIAKECVRREASQVFLLYADQERFYLPEFAIFREEIRKFGIDLVVISEMESSPCTFFEGDARPLFVDFPFLYHNHALNRCIGGAYERGEAEFLIPPKPFYGSKAVLGLLRNDQRTPELEAVLLSQIKVDSLETLRAAIPPTYLVHKRVKKEEWKGLCSNGRRFVLKEVVSSGMKGTVFQEDPGFEAALEIACGSYYRSILQEEVCNRSRRFRYFGENGEVCEADWYMRITVHYVMRDIADVVVTARQDKKVHGAPDCLQLGAVIQQ